MQIGPVNDMSSVAPDTPVARGKLQASTGVKFETMILKVFLEDLIPDQDAVYGSGLSGSFWKSQMAQVVAEQIARSDSLGLASYVEDRT